MDTAPATLPPERIVEVPLAADAAAEAPQAANGPVPAVLPPGKVFVSFVYTARDGNGVRQQRHDRTFLSGLADLHLEGQIVGVEGMIAQSLGLEEVRILGWRGLVG